MARCPTPWPCPTTRGLEPVRKLKACRNVARSDEPRGGRHEGCRSPYLTVPHSSGSPNMVSLSARRILRSRQRDTWDALADIQVFIIAAEAELAAMEAERVGVHRRGRKPDPELRRRV